MSTDLEQSKALLIALKLLSESAKDIDGCEDCLHCEDFQTCFMGMREALVTLSDILVRIITGFSDINTDYKKRGKELKKILEDIYT